MALRDDIIQFADELLDAASFRDYGPNGLQVEGARQVDTVASAVSCTADVFQRAADAGAQMLLVHHGLFWGSGVNSLRGVLRQRIATLLASDINLVAYHLPLDAHEGLGNNALIREALGLIASDSTFALHDGRPIGVVGTYSSPPSFDEFERWVHKAMGQAPLVLGQRPAQVRMVAICSGGGAGYVADAAALGADVLVTGEPKEPTHAEAQELGVAVVCGGHYASEVFGIRRLGERIAERFGVTHTFLDAPNPV